MAPIYCMCGTWNTPIQIYGSYSIVNTVRSSKNGKQNPYIPYERCKKKKCAHHVKAESELVWDILHYSLDEVLPLFESVTKH